MTRTDVRDLRHLAIQARSIGELPLFWGVYLVVLGMISGALGYMIGPAL